jgi:hypothetical protein
MNDSNPELLPRGTWIVLSRSEFPIGAITQSMQARLLGFRAKGKLKTEIPDYIQRPSDQQNSGGGLNEA